MDCPGTTRQLLDFSELLQLPIYVPQSVLEILYLFPQLTYLLGHFVPRRWCSDNFPFFSPWVLWANLGEGAGRYSFTRASDWDM